MILGIVLVVQQIQAMRVSPMHDGTVTAESFVLQDKTGNVRGVWSVDVDGGVSLSLRGDNGGAFAMFDVRPRGFAQLQMSAGNECPHAMLWAEQDKASLFCMGGDAKLMWKVPTTTAE